MVVFKNFLIFLVSNSIRTHHPGSQAELGKQPFPTRRKKNTFLVISLLRLQPLCQDRLKQTQCPLGGSLDFRCASLSIQATSHSSPVPRNKVSGEQGEEQAQTPELLGEGSPHMCSVTAVGLVLPKSRVPLWAQGPHSRGLCSRSGSAEPMPCFSDWICLCLFCPVFNDPCSSFCGPSGEPALGSRLAPGPSVPPSLPAGRAAVPRVSAVPSAGPSALLSQSRRGLVLLSHGRWDNS